MYNLNVAGSRCSTDSMSNACASSFSSVPSGYAHTGIPIVQLISIDRLARNAWEKIKEWKNTQTDRARLVARLNNLRISAYLTRRGEWPEIRENRWVTCLENALEDAPRYQSPPRDAPDYYFNLTRWLNVGQSVIHLACAFFLLLELLSLFLSSLLSLLLSFFLSCSSELR